MGVRQTTPDYCGVHDIYRPCFYCDCDKRTPDQTETILPGVWSIGYYANGPAAIGMAEGWCQSRCHASDVTIDGDAVSFVVRSMADGLAIDEVRALPMVNIDTMARVYSL